MVALMCGCCKQPKKNYRLYRSLFRVSGGVWNQHNKEAGRFSINMEFQFEKFNPDNWTFETINYQFGGFYTPSRGIYSKNAKGADYASGFLIFSPDRGYYNSPSLPGLDEVLAFFAKAPKPSDIAFSLEGNLLNGSYEPYQIVPFDKVYSVFLDDVRRFYNGCVDAFPRKGFEGVSNIWSLMEM